MQRLTASVLMGAMVLGIALLVPAATAQATEWLVVGPNDALAMKEIAPADPVKVDVLGTDALGLDLRVQAAGVPVAQHKTKGGEFVSLTWPDTFSVVGEVGTPELPVVRRLFVAPPGAAVTVDVQAGEARQMTLPLPLIPRQAPIEKLPGARERAPFVVSDEAYRFDGDLLPLRAQVYDAGMCRGQRLMLLEVYPVSYNPAAQTVTLWNDLDVHVSFAGGTWPTGQYRPLQELRGVVLNPQFVPQVAQSRNSGIYQIVVAQAYSSDITYFANAKAAQGFTVNTYVVPTGSSNTVIKTYLQNLYGTANQPDYILLVGDTDTIPHWDGQGAGSPDTDLQYGCFDGTSDWYPDIPVGRFSVRSTAHLQAIVDKTLYYENGPLADPDYLYRAVFMASEDNYSVSEGTHNYVINTHMIPNGYTCDKLYSHTYNATTQQVRDAFNNGRFFGIYSGHGGTTSWADGPPFSQTDVNNLTNVNMYPFIMSFACVTGTFTADECFIETWSRAPNKAAVTAVGSSVNSYWTEDDVLERRQFDSIFDDTDNVDPIVGPVWIETLTRYLAQMGSGSTTRRYFEMYNLMGDPSVKFPGSCSDAGTLVLDSVKYACTDTVALQVVDCGLNLDDNVIETVDVTIVSTNEPAGETVTLTETDAGSATFEGTINLSDTNSVGVLLVAEGDVVTATYIDADDGQGNYNVAVVATATVDCTAPLLSNVQTTNIEPRSATVTFDANEAVQGMVHYGLSCGALNDTATGGGYSTSPTVDISGLQVDTLYYYAVEGADEAGNSTYDDNGGGCYWFMTPEVPDYFTELFDNFDLDGLQLTFLPLGGNDYYFGCTEAISVLPINPKGGTVLSLSDDDYEAVTLTGKQVSLYGQSYSTFYVGSNGYITFTAGDTDTSETYADHFDLPRISGLFDDLNPAAGGEVSYKELADRVAVTYDAVYEYNTTTPNTFQIELFFDGTIRISYVGVGANDGLAGLSEGLGVSPDFLASDLSAMGACGPRPPRAENGALTTPWGLPNTVGLVATDDGLPNPPGALVYVITALPPHGSLADPQAGAITAVPYTLVMGGDEVVYTADMGYEGADSFDFVANDGGVPPEGGDSNTATVFVTSIIPDSELVYDFPLDSDPGWTTEGAWAFGQPTGGGSHNGDPASGHTGSNVYGYNLSGDYTSNLPETYLTTTALDCSNLAEVELRFWRWLGVERVPFDHARVYVSNDGVSWNLLYANSTISISEYSWSHYSYDISLYADGQSTVYIRWQMGPTDDSGTYPGWNIDDIEIWAAYSGTPALHIVASDPASGTIDAAQPLDPGSLLAQGWTSVDITFDGAADALTADKFAVTEVCLAGNCDGVAPTVAGVVAAGSTATVQFDRPIDPAAWTVVTYVDGDPLTDVVALGFLPCDTDNSRTVGMTDVLTVIDYINDALAGGNPPMYCTDIDRSGVATLSDLTRLIDVLVGQGEFDEYLGMQLPEL